MESNAKHGDNLWAHTVFVLINRLFLTKEVTSYSDVMKKQILKNHYHLFSQFFNNITLIILKININQTVFELRRCVKKLQIRLQILSTCIKLSNIKNIIFIFIMKAQVIVHLQQYMYMNGGRNEK